ncbi:hypothetical protein [Streptomyces sp. NPDC087297]|uniref:hypothetical protein n=1 Tax=Streptomyces sp. NPDC087297 TaxID=3365778 RepID=UPI003822ADD6
MGSVEWWGFAAAAASSVAAGASWWVAVQSKRIAASAAQTADLALDTSREAAKTAESVARIEHIRAHHDLAPKLSVRLVQQNPNADSRLTLTVTWLGPGTLEQLAEVRVTVRDDGIPRRPSTDPGRPPSAENLRNALFSPYQLQPGISGASADGRTALHADLELGRSVILQLERTMHPHWYVDAEHWRVEQEGQPVRLLITAVHPEFRPWNQVFDLHPERPWEVPAPDAAG